MKEIKKTFYTEEGARFAIIEGNMTFDNACEDVLVQSDKHISGKETKKYNVPFEVIIREVKRGK